MDGSPASSDGFPINAQQNRNGHTVHQNALNHQSSSWAGSSPLVREQTHVDPHVDEALHTNPDCNPLRHQCELGLFMLIASSLIYRKKNSGRPDASEECRKSPIQSISFDMGLEIPLSKWARRKFSENIFGRIMQGFPDLWRNVSLRQISCLAGQNGGNLCRLHSCPMGWNSWNTFGWQINEQLIFEMADLMASQGYARRGMNIWSSTTGACASAAKTAASCPDPEKFPHGMKAVADYVLARD